MPTTDAVAAKTQNLAELMAKTYEQIRRAAMNDVAERGPWILLAEGIVAHGWVPPEQLRSEVDQVARTIEAMDAIVIDDWQQHAAELKAEIARLRTLIRDVRAPLDDPHLPFVQAALKARQVFQDYDGERAAGKDDNS